MAAQLSAGNPTEKVLSQSFLLPYTRCLFEQEIVCQIRLRTGLLGTGGWEAGVECVCVWGFILVCRYVKNPGSGGVMETLGCSSEEDCLSHAGLGFCA